MKINFETTEIVAGIATLVIAGFVVEWWALPEAILFCLGLLLLCLVSVEQEVSHKRS